MVNGEKEKQRSKILFNCPFKLFTSNKQSKEKTSTEIKVCNFAEPYLFIYIRFPQMYIFCAKHLM